VGFRPFLVQVLQEDEEAAREALKPLLEEPEPIDEETLARLAEEAAEPEDTQE
jgi:DNA-binding MltR family transcriptional regulator